MHSQDFDLRFSVYNGGRVREFVYANPGPSRENPIHRGVLAVSLTRRMYARSEIGLKRHISQSTDFSIMTIDARNGVT